MRRLLLSLFLGGCCLASGPARAADAVAPNLLDGAVTEGFRASYDPWRGTDGSGALRGLVGSFPAVNAMGQIQSTAFAPSIDAADFGRGVLDLVVGDSQGHFWYYPNSGTKEAPKFTSGTPLPFFLTPSPPMIQLADNGGSHTDLIVGTGDGRLFFLRNGGSGAPRFEVPQRIETAEVKTRHDGKLWCNFLSPAYAHWRSEAAKDLLLGDGTYASDNVYYLKNKGSEDHPQFEDPVVLLPGGGRQQLTIRPWPGSGGRPDLLVGDRDGKISLYANATGPSDELPRFKPPQPLRLGASESFGAMARFGVADLNGDGKPDLVLGLPDGTLKLALNTGTAEQPKFDRADPLKGDPGTVLAEPTRWSFNAPGWTYGQPPGAFFFVLRTVGGDPAEASTYEEGFVPPEGGAKHAVKFGFDDPPPGGDTYPIPHNGEGDELPYRLFYSANGTNATQITLQEKTNYEIRFQAKGSGFSKVTLRLGGSIRLVEKKGNEESYSLKSVGVTQEIDLSSSWHEVRIPFSYQIDKNSDNKEVNFFLTIESLGKGAYYLSDASLRQVK